MEIFHRIYPGKAEGRPFFDGNKQALVYICLASLLQSANDAKITVMLDGCPQQWQDMVKSLLSARDNARIINTDGIGNLPSFQFQISLALESKEDLIFFSEDDYLYVPDAIQRMQDFAAQSYRFFTFFTTYDHPDRYRRTDDRETRSLIKIATGGNGIRTQHWRTTESTCMTFGCDRWIIEKNEQLMKSAGCTGRGFWYPLIDKGYELWSPIPSLATHVMDGNLPVGVDWVEVLLGVMDEDLLSGPAFVPANVCEELLGEAGKWR